MDPEDAFPVAFQETCKNILKDGSGASLLPHMDMFLLPVTGLVQ